MKDTLRSLALDWKRGRIGDEEAYRRARLLDQPTHHTDGSHWGEGDGGWWDGQTDNTEDAVLALAPDHMSHEDAYRFLQITRQRG